MLQLLTQEQVSTLVPQLLQVLEAKLLAMKSLALLEKQLHNLCCVEQYSML